MSVIARSFPAHCAIECTCTCTVGCTRQKPFKKIKIVENEVQNVWLQFESSNLHIERVRCAPFIANEDEANERNSTSVRCLFSPLWNCGVRSACKRQTTKAHIDFTYIDYSQCHRRNKRYKSSSYQMLLFLSFFFFFHVSAQLTPSFVYAHRHTSTLYLSWVHLLINLAEEKKEKTNPKPVEEC